MNRLMEVCCISKAQVVMQWTQIFHMKGGAKRSLKCFDYCRIGIGDDNIINIHSKNNDTCRHMSKKE